MLGLKTLGPEARKAARRPCPEREEEDRCGTGPFAILRHLEDLEDAHLARERLKRTRGRVSLEELEGEREGWP